MTKSLEDYLERIYTLRQNLAEIRAKDISKEMGVSHPSVNQAIKELVRLGFIKHLPYGAIELTQTGIEEAKSILNKHQTIKTFLINGLGISEENAEKDACSMEHIISMESFEHIQEFNQKKNLPPCSVCIQEDTFCENADSAIPLSTLEQGKKAVVVCIYGGECIKNRLQEYGFLVNETIEMVRNTSNCPLLILVKGYQIALGRGIGKKILVKMQEPVES